MLFDRICSVSHKYVKSFFMLYNMVYKIFLYLIITISISTFTSAHQGRVFIDKNKNGVWEKDEKGLSGIMVSDGLNVVKTSKDGTYILPGHTKEKFIFISIPSGYRPNNTFYQNISSEIESYNFPVQVHENQIRKDGSHLFIHFSDTEISGSSNAQHPEWVQNIRDYAVNEGAAFIMHTGDICNEEGLKNHIKLMNSDNMNTQMFYGIGNHDLVKGNTAEQMYEQYYGPTFYSFNVGNVHYIMTPMLKGDYRPSYTKEDVYRWLKNDLAHLPKGTPIIMFCHNLPTTNDSFIYGINKHEFIDLDEHHLKAWIYGHWHINHIHKHKNAYSICTSTPTAGGIDHATAAFRIIRVDREGNISSELRYPYINKTLEIASIDNSQVPVLDSGKVPLSVNCYSTISPVVNISYNCTYRGKKIAENNSFKQNTNFNWYTEFLLPEQLKGERITITVKAMFKNGEAVQTRKSFIYDPFKPVISVKGDWNNFLKNSGHTGNITSDSLAMPLQLAWIQNVGSNIYMTSPVIYKNNVFVASMDENNTGNSSIVSMNIQTGRINWKHAVRYSIKNSIAAFDGLVLAQDVEGNLYAIHVATGKLVWERKLNVKKVHPPLIEGVAINNGIAYAGSGTGLCAIRLKDGKELWRNDIWQQNHGSTATLSIENNVLIASSHWGELFAHDATNGKLLWRDSKDGIRHRSSSAIMQGGVLYLTSDNSLFVIEAQTGHILIRKELPYNVNVASSPLVTENEIIFGTARNGIVALDRKTFNEKWIFRTRNAMVYTSPYVGKPACNIESSPIMSGNAILIGGADGVIYALDKVKGSLLWKHVTGAPILSSFAISGNTLLVADFSGNVYAFTEKN